MRQYMPYGSPYPNESAGSVSTSTTPFGFDGQRLDGTGSLYYFNARFYSPTLGRFLSADSEIHNPTVPQALNRYAFAGGNPVRYVDPSGHSWYDFLIGAAIFVAIIVIAAVSGGAGLALFALAAGAVGFGIGMGVAAGLGYSPGSESFWSIALTGALIGAGIGGGAGAIVAEGADAADAAASVEEDVDEAGAAEEESPAKTTVNRVRQIGFSMLKSIMFGGPQAVMLNELNGGGTSNLLLATEEGIGTSALGGAIMGGATNGATLASEAVDNFGTKLGDMLLQQGYMFTFAGLTKQGAVGFTLDLPRTIAEKPSTDQTFSRTQCFTTQSTLPPLIDPTPY
jgi:RHS repeat-associated protein